MEQMIINLITEYAVSFAILAGFTVPLITELVFTRIGQPAKKFWNSAAVFLIALALTFAAWPLSTWTGFGFLAEVTLWWHVAIWGIGAGAVAQWTWANVETIKLIIQFIINANIKYLQAKRK